MTLLQRPIFTCLMCTVHRHRLCSRNDQTTSTVGGFVLPDCTCQDIEHSASEQ